MTRDDIIAEAARRLGDASAEFTQQVSLAFDYVLGDLAANECIGDLRRAYDQAELVADQRDYSTRDLTGLNAPDWPDRILAIRIWSFGSESLIEGPVPDTAFEARRAADGEDATGRPRIWRLWPNSRTLQFHPPPGVEEDGDAIECLFMSPPSTLAGADDIEEIRREDLETVVYGLKARLAPFLDETVSDPNADWQLYLAGRERMWARLHNGRIGEIVSCDG